MNANACIITEVFNEDENDVHVTPLFLFSSIRSADNKNKAGNDLFCNHL